MFSCSSVADLPREPSLPRQKGKIQIWGMGGSTCTQRVIMTCLENEAEWELKLVDLRTGAHKSPEHLARQPFGQIPAITDGDFTFYESRAICKYIDETRGRKLVPRDPKARALMEQWMCVEQGVITPEISGIVAQRIFAPLFGGQTDEEIIKAHVEKAAHGLDLMEKTLSKQSYLTGEQFTLADLYMMPYFNLSFATPEKHLLESRPNIMEWWKRCTARPSWIQTQTMNEFMPK